MEIIGPLSNVFMERKGVKSSGIREKPFEFDILFWRRVIQAKKTKNQAKKITHSVCGYPVANSVKIF